MTIFNQIKEMNKAQLADLYVSCIGYDPFVDSPNNNTETVRSVLIEWHIEAGLQS